MKNTRHNTPHVGYCPLSDTIQIGRGRDGCFVGKHYDATPSAVEALIHYVCPDYRTGGTREVFFGESGYRITVKRIKRVAAPSAPGAESDLSRLAQAIRDNHATCEAGGEPDRDSDHPDVPVGT